MTYLYLCTKALKANLLGKMNRFGGAPHLSKGEALQARL